MEEKVSADFRQAMRRLAATVTVVSCIDDAGIRHGMTATAVTSLCLSPPSLLVCVNRSSAFHARIERAPFYAINLLRTGQEDVSMAFGGLLKGEDRFSVGTWNADATGTPYLEDAQATILCAMSEFKAFRSHTIFIGEVKDVRFGREVSPLIFQNGSFARTSPLA